MKERPIIFNGAMVRALLDGSKTQTRRIVKPQPQPNGGIGLHSVSAYKNRYGDWAWVHASAGHGSGGNLFSCPYGQPGDMLWVRETWQGPMWSEQDEPADKHSPQWCEYKADGGDAPEYMDGDDNLRQGWKPSIHMPRWASRITLEITEIRIERLQDISEEDAIAEGIEPNWIGDLSKGPNGFGGDGWTPNCGWRHYTNSVDGDEAHTAIESYKSLWESINGPGSWDANPLVWVVSFKPVK